MGRIVYSKQNADETVDTLRGKKFLGVDKDGVLIDLRELVYIHKKNGFEKYGIKLDYDKEATYRILGVHGFTRGSASFIAFLAFDKWFDDKKPVGTTKNEAMKKLLRRPDAHTQLNGIISRYMKDSDIKLAEEITEWDKGRTFEAEEFAQYVKSCNKAKDAFINLANFYNGNIAIITNTRKLETVKRDLGVIGFSASEIGSLVIVHDAKKPSPEKFSSVIAAFSAAKGETALVGDTVVDVNTAKNSGVTSVGVLSGASTLKDLKGENVDIVVKDLNALYGLIRPGRHWQF